MIKAIIFDKDGTLLEFSDIWYKGIIKLLDSLNLKESDYNKLKFEIGIDKNSKIRENSILASGSIKDLADCIDKYSHIPVLEKDIEDIFIETIKENPEKVKQTCDLRTLFTYLIDNKIKIIVSTSDNLKVAEKMFDILGIITQIDYLISADCFPAKPNPSSIEFIKDKFKLENEQILMVGDSRVDMEYGILVKASVGVLCGTGSEEMLIQYADIIVENPLELIDILYKFD